MLCFIWANELQSLCGRLDVVSVLRARSAYKAALPLCPKKAALLNPESGPNPKPVLTESGDPRPDGRRTSNHPAPPGHLDYRGGLRHDGHGWSERRPPACRILGSGQHAGANPVCCDPELALMLIIILRPGGPELEMSHRSQ